MYIICGLGNPGKEYENSRHNMGFLTMDVLSSRLGISIKKLKCKALIGEGRIGEEKVVLVKPQTYMNLSGEALRPLMDFYKADISKLLVVYDDIDLEVGGLRIRRSGSAGTHNGMRSIIYQLGTEKFPRIRIGIGDHGIIPLEKYVLMSYTKEERPALAEAVLNASLACELFVTEGIDQTMKKFNINPPRKKNSVEKDESKDSDNG
jgi:peptidyl-tRNA hydrolase, PTH1 family